MSTTGFTHSVLLNGTCAPHWGFLFGALSATSTAGPYNPSQSRTTMPYGINGPFYSAAQWLNASVNLHYCYCPPSNRKPFKPFEFLVSMVTLSVGPTGSPAMALMVHGKKMRKTTRSIGWRRVSDIAVRSQGGFSSLVSGDGRFEVSDLNRD